MTEGTISIIDRKPVPFPVWKSTVEVYRGVFTNFFGLLRAAWLPLLVYVLLRSLDALIYSLAIGYRMGTQFPEYVKTSYGSAGALANYLQTSLVFDYATAIPRWIAMGFVAIAFHRFVLIGERRHGWKNSGLEFGAREIQFLISSLKVGLLTWVPAYIGNLIVMTAWPRDIAVWKDWYVLKMTIFTLAAGFIVRVSLTLPQAALGQRSDLGLVWRQSAGQTWRLALFSSLIFLPFAFSHVLVPLLYTVLQRLEADPFGLFTVLVGYLIDMPRWIISLMVTITSLSIAYREIIGLPDNDDAADGQGTPTPA